MATRLDQNAEKALKTVEALRFLREQGYQISGNQISMAPGSRQPTGALTEAGQHTQSYNPPRRRNIIREKLADPNECAFLLDRSIPLPEWAVGKEEQILRELEIQLLGIMDYQHPFG